MAGAPFSYQSLGEADTDRFGAALAECVSPNLLITLEGPLGAGKTRLVQALCAALGVAREEVQSPTFVLIRPYQGRLPIYHLDAYRLADEDEFLALGPEECFDGGGVTCLEWASRVERCLPDERLEISIEVSSPTARLFRCRARGSEPQQVLDQLEQRLAAGDRKSQPSR